MKRLELLSTVAAGLLLTTGAAFAQGMNKDANPAPAPAAQQNAPAEKTAPNMKAGEKNADTHKKPETTGQAPAASDAGKSQAGDKMDKGAADKPMNKGAADTGKNPAANTSGQNTAPASPKSAESPVAAPSRARPQVIRQVFRSSQVFDVEPDDDRPGSAAGAAKPRRSSAPRSRPPSSSRRSSGSRRPSSTSRSASALACRAP